MKTYEQFLGEYFLEGNNEAVQLYMLYVIGERLTPVTRDTTAIETATYAKYGSYDCKCDPNIEYEFNVEGKSLAWAKFCPGCGDRIVVKDTE